MSCTSRGERASPSPRVLVEPRATGAGDLVPRHRDGPPEEEIHLVSDEVHTVIAEAKAAGVYVFAGGINEKVAPVKVSADGSVVEGSYPETRRIEGGYTILELPSRKPAEVWAAEIAATCRCDQDSASSSTTRSRDAGDQDRRLQNRRDDAGARQSAGPGVHDGLLKTELSHSQPRVWMSAVAVTGHWTTSFPTAASRSRPGTRRWVPAGAR